MKKLLLIVGFIASAFSVLAQDDLDVNVTNYIEQYKELAVREQRRAGVPAAITLAQGIHESAAGKSELAVDANNHFGIKCKKTWTGATILHDDDRRQECFRKYESSDDSYVDHSDFLKNNKRYEKLFELEKTDYIGWSQGLRKAGYATNPKYASRLIDLIEKYNLQEFTYEGLKPEEPKIVAQAVEVIPKEDRKISNTISAKETGSKNIDSNNKLTTFNGLPGFYAKKGDYLLKQAMENDIRLAKLFSINDLDNAALYDDMFIYLKKKNKKGTRKYHIVEEGESLHSISQKEAIQLKYLYIYNNLYNTDEPAVGEKIYLQEKSITTPRLRGEQAIVKKAEVIEPNKEETTAPIRITKTEKKVIIEEEKTPVSEPIATKAPIVKEAIKITEQAKTIEKPIVPDEVITQKVDSTRWINKKDSEFTLTTSNPNIIDLTKAKRIEKLLDNGNSEIEIKAVPVKTEPTKEEIRMESKEPITNKVEEKKEVIKEVIEEVKPEIIEKKREYNEKNVGDDVKDLKKKFDAIIYNGDE